jgi:hypothetical protein
MHSIKNLFTSTLISSPLMSKLAQTPPAQWLKTHAHRPGKRGQSFLELALVLPVLLIMLAGMTEVAFFIGSYLDALDLTREAARFASLRDYTVTLDASLRDCSNPSAFDFYYTTACIFSPPAGSAACTDAKFCNGFNPYSKVDSLHDDIVITAFTTAYVPADGKIEVTSDGQHPNSHDVPPGPGYWAMSNYINGNGTDYWKYDCNGNPTGETHPYYDTAQVDSMLGTNGNGSGYSSTPVITPNKGFVAVEFYYCYHQVLDLPIVSNIMPNPARIHVYTVMPLPAAQPTPTSPPTATP